MSIKVDIISGFLGAGKTTLIRKMFENGFNKYSKSKNCLKTTNDTL